MTLHNRADLNAACHLACAPRFSYDDSRLFNNTPSPSYETADQQFDLVAEIQSLGRLEPSDFDCNEIVNLFAILRGLSHPSIDLSRLSNSYTDRYSYSDVIYVVQRRLVSICSVIPVQVTPVDSCCCWATLIYMHNIFYEVSFDSRVMEILAERIISCIEQLEHCGTLGEGYTVLTNREGFWMLVMASIATKDKAHRNWLSSVLKVLCGGLGLETFISSRKVLMDILWNSKLDSRFQSLWTEINS